MDEVFDFIDSCNELGTLDELLDALLKATSQIGFAYLLMAGLPVPGKELPVIIELNGWPQEWFERYLQLRYAALDGVLLHAASTLRPFCWSEIPSSLAETPASMKVRDEAAAYGLRSGFVVPVPSFGNWHSVISFAASEDIGGTTRADRTNLVAIAMFAAARVRELIVAADPCKPLSRREREVLLWTASGKSAWEIGKILNIAEATVKEHLAHCRKKLGAGTTIQAVVEAIRRRFICP